MGCVNSQYCKEAEATFTVYVNEKLDYLKNIQTFQSAPHNTLTLRLGNIEEENPKETITIYTQRNNIKVSDRSHLSDISMSISNSARGKLSKRNEKKKILLDESTFMKSLLRQVS